MRQPGVSLHSIGNGLRVVRSERTSAPRATREETSRHEGTIVSACWAGLFDRFVSEFCEPIRLVVARPFVDRIWVNEFSEICLKLGS